MKLEALKPVKSCLTQADLNARENFQNILLPEKLLKRGKVPEIDEQLFKKEESLMLKQSQHVLPLVQKLTNISDSCT